MTTLRELKARKAKHGFACDGINTRDFLPIGTLLLMLKSKYPLQYTEEMVGRDRSDFRIYTDSDEVAGVIANFGYSQVDDAYYDVR